MTNERQSSKFYKWIMSFDPKTVVFCMYLAFFLFLGALYVGVVAIQSTQEAAAFNRLTDGPKVTAWDAVWLDLRIEAR